MSTEQVKVEIEQILQKLPEENLVSVLEFLRAAERISAQKIKLAQSFNQIIEEDKSLLLRLAQ